MSRESTVRWGWLRFMYVYTIVGAGGFGLGLLAIPGTIRSVAGTPSGDAVTVGVTGSLYLAFGLVSILGLRAPLQCVPVLLMQLVYKVVWFVAVLLPLLVAGKVPAYALVVAGVFATYVIGDLIAIPFARLFAKPSDG